MVKFSKEWNQEFDFLKEMQEDRMTMKIAMTCFDRCSQQFWINNFLPFEKSCLDNCFSKQMQATPIMNNVYSQFETAEQQKKRRK